MVGKTVDEIVFFGIAEFLANQALKESVVGLQFLNALLELCVLGEQPIANYALFNAMLAQNEQITRSHRSIYAIKDQRAENRR